MTPHAFWWVLTGVLVGFAIIGIILALNDSDDE